MKNCHAEIQDLKKLKNFSTKFHRNLSKGVLCVEEKVRRLAH